MGGTFESVRMWDQRGLVRIAEGEQGLKKEEQNQWPEAGGNGQVMKMRKQPLRTDLLGQSLSIIGLKPPLSYNAMLTSISLAKYRYHILQVDWCFQQ